jgi:transcriptional regulator with XRE-family HTH domain
MDWKALIKNLRAAGMAQAEIGRRAGRSQAWVSAVEAGKYGDLRWSDGEALRRLHTEVVGTGDPAPEPHQAEV